MSRGRLPSGAEGQPVFNTRTAPTRLDALRAISSARQRPADEEDDEHAGDSRDPDQGGVVLPRLRQQIRSPDVDEEAGEEGQDPRQQALGQPEEQRARGPEERCHHVNEEPSDRAPKRVAVGEDHDDRVEAVAEVVGDDS